MASPPNRLAAASPGGWTHLTNRVKEPGASRIAQIFELLFKPGQETEGQIRREVGVSFNPRPARVMQILMQDGDEGDPTTIGASIIACAEIDSLTLKLSESNFASETTLALSALSFLSGTTNEAPQSAVKIVAAVLLDDIRHLHMTDLRLAERHERFERFREIHQRLTASPFPGRLLELVNSALDRNIKIISRGVK